MIFLAIAGWIVLVGGAGAVLTKLGPWYYGLDLPDWKPPDWLFGPAWTVIFVLSGMAWWLSWEPSDGRPWLRLGVVVAFVVNGLLNVWWSYLFFTRQRPDWALREVPLLLLSIVAMMVLVGRASATAPWLLLPYLAWVVFAAFLNRSVIERNGPFA